jgi:hypothetical protein
LAEPDVVFSTPPFPFKKSGISFCRFHQSLLGVGLNSQKENYWQIQKVAKHGPTTRNLANSVHTHTQVQNNQVPTFLAPNLFNGDPSSLYLSISLF